MKKNETRELPRNLKNFQSFKLEDEQTLLATIAAQNNVMNKHLERIENNVVFFFWFIIASLITAVILQMAQ